MTALGTQSPELTGWLLLLGISVFLTGVLAFLGGIRYARLSVRRSLERTKRDLKRLTAYVSQSLQTAQEACGLLETFPQLQLSAEQLRQLDCKRIGLLETISRIMESQEQVAAEPEPESPAELPSPDWLRTPEDSVTKLPNRQTFEENFQRLQALAGEHGFTSGLLLVQIDKYDQLKKRYGIAGVQGFSRKLAGLICRSMRETDIVMQHNAETFAVLLPGVHLQNGKAVAEAIRQSVRRYHFRLNENGPEVLVTASFGLTIGGAEESAEEVLLRAQHALSRSQRRGRNQLHVDDGQKLALCPIAAAS